MNVRPARSFEPAQRECLSNEDAKICRAFDLELGEHRGRSSPHQLLRALSIEPPKLKAPTPRQIAQAIRVLRGAVAQENAWASYAAEQGFDAQHAIDEANDLNAVINFLLDNHG